MPTTPASKKKPISQAAASKVVTSKFNVTDKALLCIIDFKKAGNSAKLPPEKVKVDADKKMVRASKSLLDSKELLAINAFDGQVQDYLRTRALPSPFKGGIWLVPMDLIDAVDEKLTEFETERKALVELFIDAYAGDAKDEKGQPRPSLRDEAREKLKSNFDENDYPEPWKMRAQFSLKWRYVAFGVPNSLKSVKEAIFKREQEKAESMWQEATGEIQNLLRANMAKLVNHIVDRLTPDKSGKAKKFQGTLTDNLLDFLGTFDARNICDDDALRKLVDEARGLVKGVEVGKLRDDKELREHISKGFGKIAAELDKIVVAKPARKVKFAKGDDGDDTAESEAKAPGAGSGNFSDATTTATPAPEAEPAGAAAE